MRLLVAGFAAGSSILAFSLLGFCCLGCQQALLQAGLRDTRVCRRLDILLLVRFSAQLWSHCGATVAVFLTFVCQGRGAGFTFAVDVAFFEGRLLLLNI